MKGKDLYERFLNLGAKIGYVLTTQKRTSIDDFVEDKADRFLKKYVKKLPNEWNDIWTDIFELGLVKGYLIGQQFDFTDPEILKNIEVIKKELVKEGLFDFVPRMRQSS